MELGEPGRKTVLVVTAARALCCKLLLLRALGRLNQPMVLNTKHLPERHTFHTARTFIFRLMLPLLVSFVQNALSLTDALHSVVLYLG